LIAARYQSEKLLSIRVPVTSLAATSTLIDVMNLDTIVKGAKAAGGKQERRGF
jgi:hypothetical protein